MLFPVRANSHANRGQPTCIACSTLNYPSQHSLQFLFALLIVACVLAANSPVDPTDQPHISPCLAAHLSTMFLFWTGHHGLARNALRAGHIKMASFPPIQSHESELSSRISSTRHPFLYCQSNEQSSIRLHPTLPSSSWLRTSLSYRPGAALSVLYRPDSIFSFQDRNRFI